MNGESYRVCKRHYELIDGGLSRDIATFLYDTAVVNDSDVRSELKMLQYLIPTGAKIYTSPSSEVQHTIVVFDGANCGNLVCNTDTPVNDVWLNGYEMCRVFYLYNPLNLDFEVVKRTLCSISRGSMWLIYPWSSSSSSMMPTPESTKPLHQVLPELSMFHEKINKTFPFPTVANYLIEVTTAVDLFGAPPAFPKGFMNHVNKFAIFHPHPFSMAIPFIGQHSCFMTNSVELSAKVNDFFKESKAYKIAMGTQTTRLANWGKHVRDFNITVIMCCLAEIRGKHAFSKQLSIVAPVAAYAADVFDYSQRKMSSDLLEDRMEPLRFDAVLRLLFLLVRGRLRLSATSLATIRTFRCASCLRA